MAKTPEERKTALTKAAVKLARDQGTPWKELPPEQRKGLKQEARVIRRSSKGEQGEQAE